MRKILIPWLQGMGSKIQPQECLRIREGGSVEPQVSIATPEPHERFVYVGIPKKYRDMPRRLFMGGEPRLDLQEVKEDFDFFSDLPSWSKFFMCTSNSSH